MRKDPEVILIAVVSAFALAGATAVALLETAEGDAGVPVYPVRVPTPAMTLPAGDAPAWFHAVRASCNPVEVETRLRAEPAPATPEGAMHEAACYALAGRIDRARQAIETLPPELHAPAAGVVFAAGHPAADAGDEIAAGALMELVVDYWPDHYMALYHAGAARFEQGDRETAAGYLKRFLAGYRVEDDWRAGALSMLERIGEAGGS